MKLDIRGVVIGTALGAGLLGVSVGVSALDQQLEAGHPSLQSWLLPAQPPYPEGNEPTPARIELGKKLFFDPRLSGDGNMSCATCHNPMLGWSGWTAHRQRFQK